MTQAVRFGYEYAVFEQRGLERFFEALLGMKTQYRVVNISALHQREIRPNVVPSRLKHDIGHRGFSHEARVLL